MARDRDMVEDSQRLTPRGEHGAARAQLSVAHPTCEATMAGKRSRNSTLWTLPLVLSFTAIVFLSGCLIAAAEDEAWKNCDRARCRVARRILDDEFYPEIKAVGYRLPYNCPLSKDQDMYYDNEMHKKEARHGNFRCIYCNKMFKSEEFLERHFENRHPATIKKNGVCLSDYCDVLECDLHEKIEQGKNAEQMFCNPKTMQRRRHRCHSVMDACFPPHTSEMANTLHHRFEELYCSHLECEEGAFGAYHKPKRPSELLAKAAERRRSGAQSSKTSGWDKLMLVLGVLFGLLLVIFYLGVCLYKKDMTFLNDLRKLSNSKRKKRLELLKAKQI